MWSLAFVVALAQSVPEVPAAEAEVHLEFVGPLLPDEDRAPLEAAVEAAAPPPLAVQAAHTRHSLCALVEALGDASRLPPGCGPEE